MAEEHNVVHVQGSSCEVPAAGCDTCEISEPKYVTVYESLSCFEENGEVVLSVASTSGPAPTSSSSLCYSKRIHSMIQSKSQFATALEAEIFASKDHWSEMVRDDPSTFDVEDVKRTNQEVFLSLKRQRFLRRFLHVDGMWRQWVLGRKIAEGGQAEIYELDEYQDGILRRSVAKVFKLEFSSSLRRLQAQWPRGLVEIHMSPHYEAFGRACNTCHIEGGILLDDGRFAFQMKRYWGDLRKLMDLRMKENNNQGPPFAYTTALRIMINIASGMVTLHKHDILHRDLKASNVLVETGIDETWDPVENEYINCVVADYECSVGVVGTRFWRAPEILHALTEGTYNASNPKLISKSADVYSYAMTAYEVLTGLIPFEDLRATDYDRVISGRQQLEWPLYVEPRLKALLERCSHLDSQQRPTFEDIFLLLKKFKRLDRT